MKAGYMFYDLTCATCGRKMRLYLISRPEVTYFVSVSPEESIYKKVDVADWPEMIPEHLGCIYCHNSVAILLKPTDNRAHENSKSVTNQIKS